MSWSLVAPFVSMTLANVKRRERNENEVVDGEFYSQFREAKFSKIIEKYTLPQKSFFFNAVKFILGMELP